MNNIKRFVTLLLLIVSIFQFPLHAFAQEQDSTLDQEEKASSSAELQGLEEVSGESLDELNIPEILSETANPSATIQIPPIVRRLSKRHFRTNESIKFKVDNGKGVRITAKVINQNGQEISVEIQERIQNRAKFLTVIPPQQLKPGRYTLEVTDSTGQKFEQDFTWGVLAINPNKSVYLTNETAKLSMAVLDEEGEMICNANLKLKIINENLEIDSTLSTDNGLIKVNNVCNKKEFTLIPDYETEYKVGEEGIYEMELTAVTENGIFSISDSFEVKDSVPFDVERITATRIFPPEIYPVTLKIKANKDFSGIITETVPASFNIPDLPPNATVSTVTQKETVSEDVLGASVDLIMPFDTALVGTTSALTSGFGEKLDDPILQEKYEEYGVVGHDGVDFDVPIGTDVVTVDDGKIVLAKENNDYGTTVVVEHSWGKSYYGHLSEIKVEEGKKISKGEKIALSGNTGLSTAPHLHFGVKPKENDIENGFYGKVDPLPYLGIKARGVVLGTSVDENKVKIIAWDVDLQKGEEIELSYAFKAPDISPQFYLLGPLKFLENGEKIIFKEKRRWQIAADNPAVIDFIHDEETTEQNHTGDTNWSTELTMDKADFTSDAKYLIIVKAMVSIDSLATNLGVRVAHGTTPTVFDRSSQRMESGLATTFYPYFWFTVFDQPTTTEDIIIQMKTFGTGETVLLDQIEMLAINLDDLDTDDWRFNQSTTSVENPDPTPEATNRAAITWTPASTENWMLLWGAEISVNRLDIQHNQGLWVDTVQKQYMSAEGEDAAEVRVYGGLVATQLDNTEHTLEVRTGNESTGGSHDFHEGSAIFALRLPAFEDSEIFAYDDTEIDASQALTEVANIDITPTTTGSFVVIASAVWDTSSVTPQITTAQMTDAGTVFPTGDDTLASIIDPWEVEDEIVFTLMGIQTLQALASEDLDFDVRTPVAQTLARIEDRSMVTFSLELAGGGGASPTNAQLLRHGRWFDSGAIKPFTF